MKKRRQIYLSKNLATLVSNPLKSIRLKKLFIDGKKNFIDGILFPIFLFFLYLPMAILGEDWDFLLMFFSPSGILGAILLMFFFGTIGLSISIFVNFVSYLLTNSRDQANDE